MNEKQKSTLDLGLFELLRLPAAKGDDMRRLFGKGVCFGLLGFVLTACPLPFAVAPLGVALLCAATEALPFCLLGFLIAGMLFFEPIWLFPTAALLLMLTRLLARLLIDMPTRLGEKIGLLAALGHIRGRLFAESLYLRMTSSCVVAFFLSLVSIVRGGFRYYDLYGALFSMAVAPVATFVYAGLFPRDESLSRRTQQLLSHITPVLTAASVCLSLADIRILGLSPAIAVAFGALLYILQKQGAAHAALCAILCSLSLGLDFLPVFLIALLGAFCLIQYAPIASGAVATALAGICTCLLQGIAAGSFAFLSFALGLGLFLPLVKAELPTALASKASAPIPAAPSSCFSAAKLAAGFTALSALAKEPDQKCCPPAREEYERLCDQAFDEFCNLCPNCETCWEDNYAILKQTVEMLTEALVAEPNFDELTPPPAWQALCPLHEQLWEELRAKEKAYHETRFLYGECGFLAEEYAVLAEWFTELEAQEKNRAAANGNAARAVMERLSVLGFSPINATVCGEEKRTLSLTLPLPVPDEGQLTYLRRQLQAVLDGAFSPFILTPTEGFVTLQAEEKTRYEVTHAYISHAAEQVCGDHTAVFCDAERGLYYALLNDGMGTGRTAADMAQAASAFLAHALPAGISVKTALSLLNHFLRHRQKGGLIESDTTVDLFVFNRFTGHAVFYKCGAAPSYIKRGTNIFRLTAGTVPLGILPHVDAGTLAYDLQADDLVFLMSDGIADEAECAWLPAFLTETRETDPSVLAALLTKEAQKRGSLDDLSAIVLRVEQMAVDP